MPEHCKYEDSPDLNFIEYRELPVFKSLFKGIPSEPFAALPEIVQRAELLLRICHVSDIEAYTQTFEWMFSEHYEAVFQGERESTLKPKNAMDAPREIATLKEVLNHLAGKEGATLQGWPHLFAVFGLLKVAEVVDELSGKNLVLAGEAAVDAMDAVSFGERLALLSQMPSVISSSIEKAEKGAEKTIRSEFGKRNASRRYEPHKAAKAFVRGSWATQKSEYNDNKTAFCRDYAPIVANKFQTLNGDPLKITEKQMREVWLRDTPYACKQAG